MCATPEPTMLTKVGGVGAVAFGSNIFIDGGTQMFRLEGGINLINNAFGAYGNWVNGDEGEVAARFWISISEGSFTIAGAMGNTNLRNIPLKQLPAEIRRLLKTTLDMPSKTFSNGELFETFLTTQDGLKVGVLAETEISGATLALKDITIYADGSNIANTVGARTFILLQREVALMARQQGFTKLILGGKRAMGSTSAVPGKAIEIIIDLTQ